MRHLIICVGKEERTASGIHHCIVRESPHYVHYVLTRESKQTLSKVQELNRREKDLEALQEEFVDVDREMYEVSDVLERMENHIRDIYQKDPQARITVDITFGTKTMSCGMLLAAVLLSGSETNTEVLSPGRKESSSRVFSVTILRNSRNVLSLLLIVGITKLLKISCRRWK